MNNSVVYFAKIKPNAIIPTKRNEDAGYDIYANFKEEYISIYPFETIMIPTSIASAFSDDYVMILKERGSTGIKGIAQRCGVIDSGFRNEWKVPITNTTDHVIIIAKIPKNSFEQLKQTENFEQKFRLYGHDPVVYPYTKAIAQAILLPVPKVNINEITYEKLQTLTSERNMGMLGSSNK